MPRAVKAAVRLAPIAKPARCPSLRHSFVTRWLENGDGIRTVQELLCHKDVSTSGAFRPGNRSLPPGHPHRRTPAGRYRPPRECFARTRRRCSTSDCRNKMTPLRHAVPYMFNQQGGVNKR
ncbi:MAG: tyrosine-type recombinase/integrase [Verrucomicrobia bacterium]|nr:tyrosine-type recombinase/integrase [Verrucomicrobiota bacterium]